MEDNTKEVPVKEVVKKIKKEVVCISLNEHHRTAILEPKGYSIGEKAKYPLMVNPNFEFTVTGDNQQIVQF